MFFICIVRFVIVKLIKFIKILRFEKIKGIYVNKLIKVLVKFIVFENWCLGYRFWLYKVEWVYILIILCL